MKIDGKKLKDAREKEGLSLAEVATIAGFKSSERIRQLENDGGDVNRHILKAVARALKINVSDLE